MSKRVLLTGAGGFVGSHTLIHFLRNTDWEIVVTDSFRHMGKIDRLTQMLDPNPEFYDRVTFITHDLTVPFSEQTINKIGGVDYIVSMASDSHVDRSITDPRPFVENNVSLILTLLEFMRLRNTEQNPIQKFIQVSTDEVFGPALNGHDHKEGEPHRPSNPYSASKAAQEDICYSYWRTYDLPIIQTNTMNIFGEMQDPEKLIPKTIKSVVNGDTMPIFADSKGVAAATRKYLHARTQADALLFVLNTIGPSSFRDDVDMTRLNIVGEQEISNLDMALMVAKFVGKPLKYELVDYHSSRPGHDLRYSLDGTIMSRIGWKPAMSFEDSLKSTVEWTMAHPEWML